MVRRVSYFSIRYLRFLDSKLHGGGGVFVSVLWRLVRRKLFQIVSQERILLRLASLSSNEQVPDQIAQLSDGRGRPFI